jgi:membrane protease YdiL (CAAX protease family)
MKTQKQQKHAFTAIDLALIYPAMLVMWYLALRYWGDVWAQFALMLAAMVTGGYIILRVRYGDPLFPTKRSRRWDWATAKPDRKLPMHAGIIAATLLVIQVIGGELAKLTFTAAEEAMYFAFAAPCEEVFWRGLLISVLLLLGKGIMVKGFAIIVTAAGFALTHQSYWSDWTAMFVVVASGIALGAFYVQWQDLTASILAHFLVNIFILVMTYNTWGVLLS